MYLFVSNAASIIATNLDSQFAVLLDVGFILSVARLRRHGEATSET